MPALFLIRFMYLFCVNTDSGLFLNYFKYLFCVIVTTLQKGDEVESTSRWLIGNRFQVTLRFVSPKVCKQWLRVKTLKGWSRAEKELKTKISKSTHKLRQVINWKKHVVPK